MTRRIRAEEIPLTLPDRLVNWWNPVRGRERFQARAMMAMSGAYKSTRRDRRALRSWNPSSGSADADVLPELAGLRDQAMDLERTDPLAAGAVGNSVSSVVGTGLSLQCAIDAQTLGMSIEEAERWQEATERKFRSWAGSPAACDAAATLHFYAQQGLVFRSFLSAGDVFVLTPMIPRRASDYSLKLHVIEGHRVCNPAGKADSDELAGGIRRDPLGAPVSYLIRRSHPGSIYRTSTEYDEIPAFGAKTGRRNVLHIYDKTRPGMSRGVPYLAPVIELLKEISTYSEAEIRAAVVAGMFTGFIEQASPSGLAVSAEDGGADAVPGSDIKMGNGAIVELGLNEKISFGNPGRPNSNFGEFVDALATYVGVALQQPKEVLLKQFTASYSAARAALLDAWRYVTSRRELLAMMFCQPVYEAWLEEAVARGRVVAPGFFESAEIRTAYCGAEWKGDAPPEIDPLKAVDAAEKRIALTLSTKTAETTQLTGGDFQSNVSRRGREIALERQAGIEHVAAVATRTAVADDGGDGADRAETTDPLDQEEIS